MFRSAMLVAAISGSVVSSSFGGFVMSATTTSVDGTLDRIDLYARNTGGDTGTGLLAVELSSFSVSGAAVWRSNSAGNWSPTNPADIANRSWVRIDEFDVSSTSLVSKAPSANQPLNPAYGPLTVSLGTFSIVVAGLSGAVPAETGNGAHFASLYVSKNFAASFSGYVGGSSGAKVPFGSPGPVPVPPVIAPVPDVNVVFGQIVTDGATFSVNVTATDGNQGDTLSLAVGPVPGVSDVVVTPASALTPAVFTVTGRVDYSLNGTTVVVPLSVSDGLFTATSSFRLIVTPEPGMLSLLVASGCVRRRR